MHTLYLVLITYSIVNVIEARLERTVIALKNPSLTNYSQLNRDEHRWSGFYYGGVCMIGVLVGYLLFGFTWKLLPVMFLLLVNRRIFFEFTLKRFRNRKLRDIEGDQPLDVFVRGVFGKQGGLKELFLLVILSIALIYITLKF
jgi:hypothetical protein